MFEIATNKEGVACIVTDNPKISDAIRREAPACDVPVWFTAASDLAVVQSIADGMALEFGRKTVVIATIGLNVFHAAFTEPAREGAAVQGRIAQLHQWLSEHESMLASARRELNAISRTRIRSWPRHGEPS